MRPEPVRKRPSQEDRRLAKRISDVQQAEQGFPVLWKRPETAKSRRIPAAFRQGLICGRALPSEPVGLAPVGAAIPPVIVPVHAALEAALAPALAPEPALHMGQDGQPPLLAVVQRLV